MQQQQDNGSRAAPGQGIGSLALALAPYIFFVLFILARSWRRPLDLTFIFFPPGCAWPGRGVHAPILLSKVKMLALQIFKVSKVSKVSNLNNKTGEIIR